MIKVNDSVQPPTCLIRFVNEKNNEVSFEKGIKRNAIIGWPIDVWLSKRNCLLTNSLN